MSVGYTAALSATGMLALAAAANDFVGVRTLGMALQASTVQATELIKTVTPPKIQGLGDLVDVQL
jgi:hypothetical protein